MFQLKQTGTMKSKVIHKSIRYCLLLSYLLLMLHTSVNDGIVFKMTNVICKSYNKSWVTINRCRLKAVQRNITTFNLNLDLLHPLKDIQMRVQVQKKGNGYKPWLFDFHIDACRYFQRPNNPAFKLIYGIFKDSTNFNHTCPYTGRILLKDFYPRIEKLRVPLPTGDYLLNLTFFFTKQQNLDVSVFFTFVED